MDYDFDKLIQLIPGYDPVATAGDCVFDADAAALACDFFPECLRHMEGIKAGKPFVLEPWQQAVNANLFGWKRPDGSRRYREAFIFVARKNGKSPWAAGIALFVLFCDDEIGQQNVVAAKDLEQASLLFRQAAGMVNQEPELRRRSTVYGERGTNHVRTIVIPERRSYFRVISSDAKSKHGGNLHLGIVDELHAQDSRELVDVLQTSMASANRRHPLMIHLTTADYERESICNEKYNYARKVRDGLIDDPAFLPVIYEVEQDADWTDPEVWKKANPNLGVSVSEEYIERECKHAQEVPAFLNTFKRLHLNIKTTTNVACINVSEWDECEQRRTLDELRGYRCFGGLDVSSRTDITAFVLLFPEDDSDAIDVHAWFWAPQDAADRRVSERNNAAVYHGWSKQELIELIPGSRIEQEVILHKILELNDLFCIEAIAYDPWNAEAMRQRLDAEGIETVEFTQTLKNFSAPMKEWLSLIPSGKLRHGGNPIMRWMASNLVAYTDPNENIRPVKHKSADKIDGQVAGIMALGLLTLSDGYSGSIYEEEGQLAL